MAPDASPDATPAQLGCICAATRLAARVLTRFYDDEFRSAGMPTTQFTMLSMIASRPGTSQGQLAGRLAMDQTTLSRNLSLLSRRGWIVQRRRPDARVAAYDLTDAGAAALHRARPTWVRAQARVQRALGPDASSLFPLLRKLSMLTSGALPHATKRTHT